MHQFHQDQLPQSKEPKQSNHSQNQYQTLQQVLPQVVPQAVLQAASQAFLQALTYPQTHTKNKYKTMQKTTTFPKAGLIKSVQINLDLKDDLQTVAWEKIRQDQRRTGWKQEHPDQPQPDEYPSSEQHENNKTTLIVGGIVLGLTVLIIYKIY